VTRQLKNREEGRKVIDHAEHGPCKEVLITEHAPLHMHIKSLFVEGMLKAGLSCV